MDMDEFWRTIEAARASSAPTAEALSDLLTSRPLPEILEYQELFDDVQGALYRWDTWAAAYLIHGGCSDDSFDDFCAGLVAQGRDWYQRALRSPDDLADHPAVRAAAPDDDDTLFDEAFNFAANDAYERRTGNMDAFYEDLDRRKNVSPPIAAKETDMGEDFDFDDPAEMHRRIPRLARIYLGGVSPRDMCQQAKHVGLTTHEPAGPFTLKGELARSVTTPGESVRPNGHGTAMTAEPYAAVATRAQLVAARGATQHRHAPLSKRGLAATLPQCGGAALRSAHLAAALPCGPAVSGSPWGRDRRGWSRDRADHRCRGAGPLPPAVRPTAGTRPRGRRAGPRVVRRALSGRRPGTPDASDATGGAAGGAAACRAAAARRGGCRPREREPGRRRRVRVLHEVVQTRRVSPGRGSCGSGPARS